MQLDRLQQLVAALVLATTPGCSLILTRGPEPEGRETQECTTSNAGPIADTVVAFLASSVMVLGVVEASQTQGACDPAKDPLCELGRGINGASWVAAAVGAATTALFTASAVVGYERTSACRSLVGPMPSPARGASAASTPPDQVVRAEAALPLPCPGARDAPRLCAIGTDPLFDIPALAQHSSAAAH